MHELDLTVLTNDMPDHRLRAGDVGTIVDVLGDGEAFIVEFMTLAGDTLAVLTLSADDVRPLKPREMAHAREVA